MAMKKEVMGRINYYQELRQGAFRGNDIKVKTLEKIRHSPG
jgi:hypothetical protein